MSRLLFARGMGWRLADATGRFTSSHSILESHTPFCSPRSHWQPTSGPAAAKIRPSPRISRRTVRWLAPKAFRKPISSHWTAGPHYAVNAGHCQTHRQHGENSEQKRAKPVATFSEASFSSAAKLMERCGAVAHQQSMVKRSSSVHQAAP